MGVQKRFQASENRMVDVSEKMYGEKPQVVTNVRSPGLECGLFYKKIGRSGLRFPGTEYV